MIQILTVRKFQNLSGRTLGTVCTCAIKRVVFHVTGAHVRVSEMLRRINGLLPIQFETVKFEQNGQFSIIVSIRNRSLRKYFKVINSSSDLFSK